MNYDILVIIVSAIAAIICFLPTIPLMLLPAVKRLKGGKRGGIWVSAVLVYLANLGLIVSWAGDIPQNRSGNLSMVAFYGYLILFLLAPVFYAVFFRDGKRSFVYPIIVAALMGIAGIALGLVPLLYGVNTEFGIATYIVGAALLFLPQLADMALFITLSRLSFICWDTAYVD